MPYADLVWDTKISNSYSSYPPTMLVDNDISAFPASSSSSSAYSSSRPTNHLELGIWGPGTGPPSRCVVLLALESLFL